MATKRSQAAAGGGSSPSKASKTKQASSSAAPAVAVAVAPATPEADGEASASAATATLTPTPAPEALPEKKTSVERRRSVREKCVAPAVLQPPSGDASAEAAHGVTVQDLSLGGVGFRATGKFAPGETYRITLGKGPLLLNARVRIVSCRQVGHRMFHVGAEFC
jgi:hypothetical protein